MKPFLSEKFKNLFSIIPGFLLMVLLISENVFAQTLINTENFGSTITTGWTSTSLASSDNWALTSTTSPCEGSYVAKLTATSCTQDDWIFSKGFSCTKDYRYSITFKADNTATLDVYAGNAQTTNAMTSGTTMLSTTTDYNCADVSTTTYFTCPSTGTYYFAFRVRSNCGTAKIDNIRFYETAPVTHTWNGSVSTDWSNTSNWTNGVPTSTGLVIIPTGLSNYPDVNNEVAQCKTLTINSGGSLIISSTNSSYYLEVNGDLTLNGTLNFTGTTAIKMKGTSATISFDGSLATSSKFSFESGSSYILNNGITCNDVSISSGGSLTVAASQTLQVSSFSNSGTFTLNSAAILKITGNTISFGGTNNLTNGTVQFAPTSGDITIPNGTYNNLTINAVNGYTATIGSSVTVTGDLSITNTGTAGGVVTTSGNITVGGAFNLGTSGNALTLNLGHSITATGDFTMGNNASNVLNVSYTSSTSQAIIASNIGAYVFYGSVNYTASSSDQIVMKLTYNGALTCSNAGNRFMAGTLDLNNNLTISAGKWYCGSPETVTIGTGSGSDNNQKAEISPYQGHKKSARWQMLLTPAELASMGSSDLLTSISFYVTSKSSDNAFENFTIKLGHTAETEFANSVPSYFFNDATTTVFGPQSVTTTTGWNTHTFTSPFTWDGTSYILINISFDNTGSGTWPDDAATNPDAVSYTTGAFGADALIRAEGNTSQVAQTEGIDSDDKTYTLFNSVDGPFNINITNNWLNTNADFYHLNNTVTFDGSSNQGITTNGDSYYNFTVNNTGTGLTLADNTTIENTATLTDGIITTGSNKLIVQSTTAANLTGYSAASFVYGNLRRYITSNSSTYALPVGNGTGTSNYFLSDIINSNLATTSYLDAKFVSGLPADYSASSFTALGKQMTGAGVTTLSLTSMDSKGYVQIDPDAQPTGGSYSIKLYNTNYSIGSWEDNKQVILKRSSASSTLSDFNQAGTINADGGAGRMVADGYLLSSGLTSFSIFIPGGGAAPLPITLLDFSGIRKNDVVELKWITAAEINNDYFVVNKIEGDKITPVAQVDGAGNSNQTLNYSCFDENPDPGFNYYQLTQFDYDGKFEKSEIIAVYFSNNQAVNIYPNPVTLLINIELEEIIGDNVLIEIADMLGRTVFSKSFNEAQLHYKIDLTDLRKGIYMLKINNNEIIRSEKIILN